jgi:hypothetical protein
VGIKKFILSCPACRRPWFSKERERERKREGRNKKEVHFV